MGNSDLYTTSDPRVTEYLVDSVCKHSVSLAQRGEVVLIALDFATKKQREDIAERCRARGATATILPRGVEVQWTKKSPSSSTSE